MNCPNCQCPVNEGNGKVLSTRQVPDRQSIRRRRECQSCSHRWTTFEIIPTVYENDQEELFQEAWLAVDDLKLALAHLENVRLAVQNYWNFHKEDQE